MPRSRTIRWRSASKRHPSVSPISSTSYNRRLDRQTKQDFPVRFEFKAKHQESGPSPTFDYGAGGYDPNKCNVGFHEHTGQFQIEIKGLAEPKSKEATRICQEDLNEVIAAFVQDKTALERGLFDEELVPEELTQVRMGKIIKDKYPELKDEDQEAVRQHGARIVEGPHAKRRHSDW